MKIAPPPPPVKDGEETTMKGKIKIQEYFSEQLQLYMFASYNNTEYKFVMDFDNAKLYRRVRRFVAKNQRKNIMVSGTWFLDGSHTYSAKITYESQVTAV